jgi:hypothetical protein
LTKVLSTRLEKDYFIRLFRLRSRKRVVSAFEYAHGVILIYLLRRFIGATLQL